MANTARWLPAGMLILIPTAMLALFAGPAEAAHRMDPYNVVWQTPSKDASGSMPLGNGSTGLNAWVEASGDLVFYLSRIDSWGDNARLLKVGRVRIRLDPPPPTVPPGFRQTLRLKDATMVVRYGEGEAVELRLWADANHPVIHVVIDSPQPVTATAAIELWRTGREELPSLECSDVLNRDPQKRPTVVEPDTVLAGQTGRIGWYHRNVKSVGPAMTGRIQGLEGFERPDPLLGRTFGAVIQAANGRRRDDRRLESPASKAHRFDLYVLTRHPATPDEWLTAVDEAIAATQRIPFARRREAHQRWWRDFWDRSWIHATPTGPSHTPRLVPPNTHPVRIGFDQHGGNRFAGEIGRLSLFGRGLSDADVQRLAKLPRSQPVSDRDGLLFSGTPKLHAVLDGSKDWTFEKGLAIEAWIKPDKLPRGGGRIVDDITPGGSDGFLLDTWPANSLRFIVGSATLGKRDVLPVGQWSHVAAVVDPSAGGATLYLNGVPLARQAVEVGDDAYVVSRAYALQRFITACAGRGAYPIKFNGTIFTVPHPGKPGDADYRRWGPGYWWQNTRLPYISLCTSGDFDLMQPLFAMYGRDLMPLFRYRTRLYLDHDGAYIPECVYFWGDMFSETYGWTPFDQRKDRLQASRWHKWEWVSGLELVWMMFDYYDHTLDEAFLSGMLLPTAHEILTFFDQHYKVDECGKLVMHPSQACETWWDCTNPMPELAGLHAVTDRLLALPSRLTTAAQRTFWTNLRRKLPALPTREVDGTRIEQRADYPMPNYLKMVEDPDRLAAFVERLGDFLVGIVEGQIEAADGRLAGMYIWGDVAYDQGMLFSPDFWRRVHKPQLARICDAVHAHGLKVIYHGCGNASLVFEDMIEVGVDAYNPLEAKAGLDVVDLKRRFGDRWAFNGNIDVRVLATGDREAVRREVLTKLNAAKGGGFILQSDHSVPDNVAPDTYDYVVRLGREYGTYPLDLGEFDEEV